jgi:hypothetical protein
LQRKKEYSFLQFLKKICISLSYGHGTTNLLL